MQGGCASQWDRQAQQSNGLLDFVGRMARGPRENVVPVERRSGRAVEIASATAIAERGGTTYVSGVLKQGFEAVGDDDGYIEVRVLGPDRQLVSAVKVDYSPKPIPTTYHSVVGRAYFGVRLPFVPTPNSIIQIIFHEDERAGR